MAGRTQTPFSIVQKKVSTLETQVTKLDVLLQHLMEWTHFKPPPNLDILVNEAKLQTQQDVEEEKEDSRPGFQEAAAASSSSSSKNKGEKEGIIGTVVGSRSVTTRSSSRNRKSAAAAAKKGHSVLLETEEEPAYLAVPSGASASQLIKVETLSETSDFADSDFELLPHSHSSPAENDFGDFSNDPADIHISGHNLFNSDDDDNDDGGGEDEYIQESDNDDDNSCHSQRPSSSKKQKTSLTKEKDNLEDESSSIFKLLPKPKRNSKGPYDCETCGHRTRTKTELIEHLRIHKTKPKDCENCGEPLLEADNIIKLEGTADLRVLCHICGTPGKVEHIDGKKKRKVREWVTERTAQSRQEAEKLVLSAREWKYKNQYSSREGQIVKYVCRHSNNCGSRRRIFIPIKPIRGEKVLIQRTVGEHDHDPRPSKNRGISEEDRRKIGELIVMGYVRPRAILNELKSEGIQSYSLLQIRNYIQYCQKKHHRKEVPKAPGDETQEQPVE